MSARDSQGRQDPLQSLVREHEVILTVLTAIEREVDRIAGGGNLRPGFWCKVTEFIGDFAAWCHHSKEERYLFPILHAHGMPHRGGPVGVIRHEHTEERALVDRLCIAARTGERKSLCDAARAYVYRLRQHIDKENHLMSELGRDALPPDEVQRLREGFRTAERETIGQGAGERYLGIARDLCADAGVMPAF